MVMRNGLPTVEIVQTQQQKDEVWREKNLS